MVRWVNVKSTTAQHLATLLCAIVHVRFRHGDLARPADVVNRMPLNLLDPEKSHFLGLTGASFDALIAGWGWKRFRADQVRRWVYDKLVDDAGQMSNLSRLEREQLAGRVEFTGSQLTRRQDSTDGTRKLLLTWADGANAETVMIPDAQRRTACVSSQVGCPVGCKFCASGINGVKGNLRADQIVEQVIRLNQVLEECSGFGVQGSGKGSGFGAPGSGKETVDASSSLNPEPRTLNRPRITNIVFMGMGEPLANYANVMQAIRVLHDPACLNVGARRITISTVGVPAKMRELAKEALPINLAISLHAPNEPLRKQLIPWAEHFALDEILDAARYYFDNTGREITLEYILLANINDRPGHARELAGVCKTLRANVNLIRYNEVESLPFKRPLAKDVVTFQDILRHNGVNAHVRKSRGRDIDAACGQLRRKEQEKLAGAR
jgi:23S rRNA (adenine2503-C2)-methyltransferase